MPTLVYGDLKAAGRELLARSDMDLRWAVHLEEALAVSRRVPLQLVLTSEECGLPFLEDRKDLSRQPPCVVMLSPHAMERREQYRTAGATALVSSEEPARLVEAISELTGLRFRSHPRVPLSTVVDVHFRGENQLLNTIDLSASGTCVSNFPSARYGETAILTFDLLEPPLEVQAMVVRTFHRPDGHCAGLCFTNVSDEDRQRLGAAIDKELSRGDVLEMGTGDVEGLPGTRTLDLIAQFANQKDRGVADYLKMLKSEEDLPGWLAEIGTSLTSSERKAMAGAGAKWGQYAVRVRVDLGRRILEKEFGEGVGSAMEFCQALGDETRGGPVEEAVDATQVRASLLRSVYSLHKLRQLA